MFIEMNNETIKVIAACNNVDHALIVNGIVLSETMSGEEALHYVNMFVNEGGDGQYIIETFNAKDA